MDFYLVRPGGFAFALEFSCRHINVNTFFSLVVLVLWPIVDQINDSNNLKQIDMHQVTKRHPMLFFLFVFVDMDSDHNKSLYQCSHSLRHCGNTHVFCFIRCHFLCLTQFIFRSDTQTNPL